MSFFTSQSAYYDDHPFSYPVREPRGGGPLTRVGTRLWESFLHRRGREDADVLHDMALTAQPPVLKRHGSGGGATQHGDGTTLLWMATEEILVGLVLTAAAGWLTRYVTTWVRTALSSTATNRRDDDDDKKQPFA